MELEVFKDYTIHPRILVYHDNEFELDDTRTLFFDLNKKEYLSIYWNLNRNEYTVDRYNDNEDYIYEELVKLMLFLK